jgi:hypothetical protein
MTGQTTAARIDRCGGCGRTIWVGLDANYGHQVIEADPHPVGLWGEGLALAGGRATVELRLIGGCRWELSKRDNFRIRGSPAGTPDRDVLVVHHCGLDYGGGVPHVASSLRRFTAPIYSEIPPF